LGKEQSTTRHVSHESQDDSTKSSASLWNPELELHDEGFKRRKRVPEARNRPEMAGPDTHSRVPKGFQVGRHSFKDKKRKSKDRQPPVKRP